MVGVRVWVAAGGGAGGCKVGLGLMLGLIVGLGLWERLGLRVWSRVRVAVRVRDGVSSWRPCVLLQVSGYSWGCVRVWLGLG